MAGWVFLHPIHYKDGSAAPVPWRDSVRERPKMGRHQLLLNLLHRMVTDQDLSTAPSAKEVAAEVPVAIGGLLEERAAPQAAGPILNLSQGQLQGIDAESGDVIFSVSLLMADLVYLSASSLSEAVQKDEVGEYVLALAPRSNTVTEESSLEPEDIWLLCSEVGTGARRAKMFDVQIYLQQWTNKCFMVPSAKWNAQPNLITTQGFMQMQSELPAWACTGSPLGTSQFGVDLGMIVIQICGGGATVYLGESKMQLSPQKESARGSIDTPAAPQVSYDPNLFGHYDDSTMQLLKALLQKDPNKRPSSKKSFIGLWAVAKPDVRNSSACKAAYQAVQECDQMAAHSAGLPKSQSRLAPDAAGAVTPRKVVRTSSATDVTKAAAAAAALDPERGTGEGSERSPRAPAAAPEASMAWKPRPPSAPKPPGSFSFLRGFGMGRNSGKDGKGSETHRCDENNTMTTTHTHTQ
eukprot:Skav211056  [mRNA]  locus=scaffold5518:12395:20799:+ [translate_table: standard]